MTTRMRAAAVLAIAMSLATAGCSRAETDPAFGAKVREYLLAHPELLEEMVAKLQEKKQAQAQAQARAGLATHRQALERDPRDYVHNPAGRITVVEFYDYRCRYCIASAAHTLSVVKSNPDVRFVFKELPIFGEASDRAARAALAVKRSGGDYLGLWQAFMTTQPLDDAAIDRILKARGFDPAALLTASSVALSDSHIQDNHKLAEALGIDGTPAFIIGDVLVPGADTEAVDKAIAAARAKLNGK